MVAEMQMVALGDLAEKHWVLEAFEPGRLIVLHGAGWPDCGQWVLETRLVWVGWVLRAQLVESLLLFGIRSILLLELVVIV